MLRITQSLLRRKRGSKFFSGNQGSWDSNENPGDYRSGWQGGKPGFGMYKSAINLGFKQASDMYPDYPLEEPPKLLMISLKDGKFPSMPYTQKSTSRKDGHKIGYLKRLGLSHGNTFDVVANTYENTQIQKVSKLEN